MNLWSLWKLYQKLKELLGLLNLNKGESKDVLIPEENQPTLTFAGKQFKVDSFRVKRTV